MRAPKYLILLDLNGTICYRTEEPVPGVSPDLFVRRKHYYGRPGIDEFVRGLYETKDFKICVYSSTMMHNLEAGVDAIFPQVAVRRMISGLLDR